MASYPSPSRERFAGEWFTFDGETMSIARGSSTKNHGVDRVQLLEVIEAVITPYVGEIMAQAATEVHCQKLGLVGSSLSSEQMEALLDRLAKGMAVFIGREKSAQVVADIRKRMG